ncbi:MAG: hypothetical protein AAF171_02120 [Cyanobacteria bacterium P01_A01_bin.116]
MMDIVFVLLLLCLSLWQQYAPLTWKKRLLYLTTLLLVVHISVRGRWQFIPAYMVIVGLLLLGLVAAASPATSAAGRQSAFSRWTSKRWVKAIGMVVASLLVLKSSLFLWIFPNIVFPQPTGAWAVGTTLERADDVSIRLWYPAALQVNAVPYPYLSGADIPTMTALAYSHLQKPTAAFVDVPLADGLSPLPVVLYDYGAGSFREDNTFRMIELASHGFVIAAIAHPKHFFDYNIPTEVTQEPAQFREQLNTRVFPDRLRDIRLALQKLEQLNGPESRFGGKLNLQHFGMMGFSLGGSVALEYSLEDPRCGAVVNLDGGMLGNARKGVNSSFLQLSQSALLPLEPNQSPQAVAEKTGEYYRQEVSDLVRHTQPLQSAAYWLRVHDSGHMAFSDLARWTPARFGPLRTMIGTGDVDAIARVIDEVTLAFFKDHLLNTAADETRTDHPSHDAYLQAAIQQHQAFLSPMELVASHAEAKQLTAAQ